MRAAKTRVTTPEWTRRFGSRALAKTRAVKEGQRLVQRVPDTTTTDVDAEGWFGGEGRDPSVAAERRAEAFIRANRGILRDFAIEPDVRRTDGRPVVRFRTSARAGAIPLVSPVSGRPDLGLVVEPRFQWSSVGEVMAATGMRVTPELLPLPELPQSERRIPPWVLSSVVLRRIDALLSRLTRRFVLHSADERAPRGQIDWPTYLEQRLTTGRAADVPCRYPDLREDEHLLSSIHYVLRVHRDALLTQRTAGVVVRELLGLCETLLRRVNTTAPRAPAASRLASWQRTPLSSRVFKEGLQAIEWTVEERGLAGMSELAGLAWRLDLEVFFEAWVETVVERLGRSVGARLRAGRLNQTKVPINWEPKWAGSQRSLIPDVVLERADLTVVFDAKYKQHGEELNLGGWRSADEMLREHHRNDLLQVLAYAGLFNTSRVVACLVYPCSPATWTSLVERDRVVHRARIPAGDREVELALAAIPMAGDVSAAATALMPLVQQPL